MDVAKAPPSGAADNIDHVVERVQDLQAQLESTGDSAPRELTEELVSAVVQMYGAGLERIVDSLFEAGAEGERLAARLAEAPLVATLLLIHALHPVPLEQRVQAALDSVRPYMESHGGNVALLSLEDGIARIHLQGSCSDCSASAVTLELAIKQALEDAAPDLEGLEGIGVAPQTMGGTGLPIVMSGPPPPAEAPPAPSWFAVQSIGQRDESAVVPVAVAGTPLLIANV